MTPPTPTAYEAEPEVVASNALCLVEAMYDYPNTEGVKTLEQYREHHGSYELRSLLYRLAMRIEQAYDALAGEPDANRYHLGDLLMEHTGCWDFEVIPALLQQLADHAVEGVDNGYVPIPIIKDALRTLANLPLGETK